MTHFPKAFASFAVSLALAGAIAGTAYSDTTSTQDTPMNPYPEYFADFRTTGVNREPAHTPIYGTFHDEASAEAYRKTPSNTIRTSRSSHSAGTSNVRR